MLSLYLILIKLLILLFLIVYVCMYIGMCFIFLTDYIFRVINVKSAYEEVLIIQQLLLTKYTYIHTLQMYNGS